MVKHDLIFIGTWKCRKCLVEWKSSGFESCNPELILNYLHITNHPDEDCDKVMMEKALE